VMLLVSSLFGIAAACGNGRSQPLESDFNWDGKVNDADFKIMAAAFGSTPRDSSWNSHVDFDKNGLVNILDISAAARDYGIYYGKTV
jgi:hypothetical protein